MANKINSLKKNIYFNAVLFSILFILVLIFSYSFINRYQKIEKKKQIAESLANHSDELIVIKNIAFTEYETNSGITPLNAENLLAKLKKSETTFYQDYNKLINEKFIRKDDELPGVLDSLKNSFKLQCSNISLIINSLQQRGTKSGGVVESLVTSGNNLISIAASKDSRNALFTSQQLFVLLQKQAYEKDLLYKNLIIEKAAEVKTEFSNVDQSNSSNYLSEIDNIISASSAIFNIDAALGYKSNKGILSLINTEHQKSSLLLLQLENFLQKYISRYKLKQSIFFLFTIILIFALIIGFYLFGSVNFVVKPLEKLVFVLDEMVKGRILSDDLIIDTNNNIKFIGDNINKLNSNLNNKTEFARMLNNGQTDGNLELLSDDDVLGLELISLQKNIQNSADERKAHDIENEKRRFINEGLAKFSEITHAGYDKIEKLTDKFIRELVKYLNCIQGGVFLMYDEETKPVLNLASAFAYNRKKYTTKKIAMGEGLVGTCAIEKKTIHLSEIPDDYMYVTSGLGDSPPRFIILVPMNVDDKVLGVIELASLKDFKDHEIEFLELVSVSLASTIKTTKINETTATLLDQSRTHSQKMAEQEEEMRQNMEELKATQEESARREEEFRGTIDAISHGLFVMEFNLNEELININEKLLILLGKSRDDLMGKTFPEIMNGKNSREITKELFEQISNGKEYTLIDHIKIKKKEYSFQFNFLPISNKDLLPVKVICLGIELKN